MAYAFFIVLFFTPEALVVELLVFSVALTLVHSIQEARGALWDYFGRIAGVRIPALPGFLAFTVGLTLALWMAAVAGLWGSVPMIGELSDGARAFWMGALIGGRLSDAWVSHVNLWLEGFRPNPGLSTAPLLCLEALALLGVGHDVLLSNSWLGCAGVGAGALFFMSVLPALRLLGFLGLLEKQS